MLYLVYGRREKVEQRVEELLRAALEGEQAPGLTIFSLPRRSWVKEVQALRATFTRRGQKWEIALPRVGKARERLIYCDEVRFIPFFPTGVVVVGLRGGKVVFWGRYGGVPHMYTF